MGRHSIEKMPSNRLKCTAQSVNVKINGSRLPKQKLKIPFNCEKGPLIRFFVFYCETDFDILVSVQHLLGDGNSIARLLRDVVSVYAGNKLPYQEQKTHLKSK